MDPYLNYQPAYRMVVCRQCSVGFWPHAVTAHFRSDAQELTLPQVRPLVQDLEDQRRDLCRPDELQTPVSPVVSLSGLPVYLDGHAAFSILQDVHTCVGVRIASQALARCAWLQPMQCAGRERGCEKRDNGRKAPVQRATTCSLPASLCFRPWQPVLRCLN